MEETKDSPEVEAAAKELMRLYPHLDALMASTIAWAELRKKPDDTCKDGGEEKQETFS